MELNKNNYFSLEADQYYMSVSQFKSFSECEAKTLAKIKGEFIEPKNDAFLLGSYVHAWNDGTMEQFKENHKKELFKKDGTLLAKYEIANKMIDTLANDKLINIVREGEKEVIMTADLFDTPWKIMIDIYSLKNKLIVDLKTTKSIHQYYWNPLIREHQNFIEYYDYLLQMAVYCEVERINRKSHKYFQPHIIAISKEEVPDKEVIFLGTDFIEEKLLDVKIKLDRIMRVKKGKEAPLRCEKCDYCKSTKQLKKIIHYLEL